MGPCAVGSGGSLEQVTENKRTLGSLDGGQDIHLGFGPTLEEHCGPSEACLLHLQFTARTWWLINEWVI